VNKNTKAWNVYCGISIKLLRKRKKVSRDSLQKAIKSLK
jgi:hypothetical protein